MLRTQRERQDTLYLPPRDLWLFDPETDGKIPTPLNEYGLVDADELIDTVKSTVDPSYKW